MAMRDLDSWPCQRRALRHGHLASEGAPRLERLSPGGRG
jgi:hypothetical protein